MMGGDEALLSDELRQECDFHKAKKKSQQEWRHGGRNERPRRITGVVSAETKPPDSIFCRFRGNVRRLCRGYV